MTPEQLRALLIEVLPIALGILVVVVLGLLGLADVLRAVFR